MKARSIAPALRRLHRPVVLEETGFSDVLPTGEGLWAFRTVEEAVDAIRAIRLDYDRQSRAARRIAADYFDARRVLCDLLRQGLR